MRENLKSAAGRTAAMLLPQCQYRNCIFILAHMRCGSTALSNILCSRPDVTGYGEAHIRYKSRDSLGRLVVNQALRGGWTPRAAHLFDKLLHTRHDAEAPPEFFESRAIFVARRPKPAIRSIRKLYEGLGRDEYGTDSAAAEYYLERVNRLVELWQAFPADRRVGLTHSDLIGDPEAQLARISSALSLQPPLENRYESPTASRKGGGGDPTASGKHTRIEKRADDPARDEAIALDVSAELEAAVTRAYERFVHTVSGA